MAKYRKIINKLVDQQAEDLTSSEYYLSIYFPIESRNPEEYNTEDIMTRIKSHIMEEFRADEYLDSETDAARKIVEKIEEYVKSTKDIKLGFAIFIKFNLEDENKKKTEFVPNDQVKFVILNRKPELSTYVGKIFNLDQLVWLSNISDATLILNIDTDICDIYAYEAGQINKVYNQENLYQEIQKPQYQNRFNVPSSDKKAGYGVGEGKREKSYQNINKEFLKNILNLITDPDFTDYNFNKVIIFYSQQFDDFIKDHTEKVSKNHPELDFNLKDKNINSEQELRDRVSKIVEQFHYEEKEKVYKLVKTESHDLFTKGWGEVLDKLRKSQIDILFIKPNLKHIGYIGDIGDQMFIFDYPKTGSVRVKSLAPWTVKHAIQTGAKITVLKGSEFNDAPEIAAKLRFSTETKKEQK